MRVALTLAPLVALGLTFAACDDDTAPSGGATGGDAGPTTGEGGGGGGGDGGGGGSGDVMVTVLHHGAPLSDVRVVFHDADGNVVGDTKSDASGVARGAGRQVTVVAPFRDPIGARATLYTYGDVEAGDRLVVDTPTPESASTVGAFDVLVDPPVEGYSTIEVFAGRCGAGLDPGGSPGVVHIPITAACVGTSGSTVVYAVAHDVPGLRLLGLMVKGQSSVTTPGPGKTQNLGLAGTWQDAARFVTRVGGLPRALPSGAGVTLFDNGSRYHGIASIGAPASDNGQVEAVFPGYDAYAVHASHALPDASSGPQRLHYYKYASAAGATGTDRTVTMQAADATPGISSAEASMVAPGRPEIRWTTLAPPPTSHAPRAAYAAISWGTRDRWVFVADPKRTSVRAPALPADLSAPSASFGPPPAGAKLLEPEVYLVWTSAADSFAKMRALPLDARLRRVLPDYETPERVEAYWSTYALAPSD